jgi:hypothetical protein
MYFCHCRDGRIRNGMAEGKTASPEWQNLSLSFFVIASPSKMLA